jgi:uncharacterized BrkB/YihY/UPF0761 family membrane protein
MASGSTSGLGRRFWLCGSFAAEMAFFFALSLVPFLALTAIAAVSWLPAEVGVPLATALVHVFPAEASVDTAALNRFVGTARGGGWLAAGVLFALWTSFRFMVSSLRALGFLVTGRLGGWREGLRTALSGLLLMLVWMAALLGAAFGVLASPAIRASLRGLRHGVTGELAVRLLPHAPGVAVLLLAIMLTYLSIPGLSVRPRRAALTAALATAGWLVVAWAFTGLVPGLWQGRDLYGALGSFLLFLLWCYASAWVLLLGGLATAAGRARR